MRAVAGESWERTQRKGLAHLAQEPSAKVQSPQMGLGLALLCGALQKAFLLSCLGTLERAQAASGSTGSNGCLHLR